MRVFTFLFLFIMLGNAISLTTNAENSMTVPLSERVPRSLLVIDSQKLCELPNNFRTCKSPFLTVIDEMPSREGLEDLKISGSAQFSKSSLKAVLEKLKDNGTIYIVDLRQEYHMFINGIAVSWYAPRNWGNRGLSKEQIQIEEKKLKDSLRKMPKTNVNIILEKLAGASIISKSCPEEVVVKNVMSESALVKQMGANYKRFFVVDHLRPDDQTVNDFLKFYQNLPENAWLHFHCRAGKGRTTTFMSMVDILNNAQKLPLKEILKRQMLCGGANLTEKKALDDWKSEIASEKYTFLKRFYEYVKNSNGDFSEPFFTLPKSNR